MTQNDPITCLQTPPAGTWSGAMPLPAVGARVNVIMNGCGPGTVLGYWEHAGYVGVRVALDSPPAWRRDQGTPDSYPACVFGAEISSIP